MKKKTNNSNGGWPILSVDWDYFLSRETDSFDWGHSEDNTFFYEMIWNIRAETRPYQRAEDGSLVPMESAIESVKVDLDRGELFWDKVLAGNPLMVCIADSHKDIMTVLEAHRRVRIVNFDAHHDISYGQVEHLNCGNWAGVLRKQGRLAHYTLVYPEWRKEHTEQGEDKPMPEGIDRLLYGEWPDAPMSAYMVFLCRSSCWMPSWLDNAWLRLVKLLEARCPHVVYAPYVRKARPFTPFPVPTFPVAS